MHENEKRKDFRPLSLICTQWYYWSRFFAFFIIVLGCFMTQNISLRRNMSNTRSQALSIPIDPERKRFELKSTFLDELDESDFEKIKQYMGSQQNERSLPKKEEKTTSVEPSTTSSSLSASSSNCEDDELRLAQESDNRLSSCDIGVGAGYCEKDPPNAPAGWFAEICCESCNRKNSESTTKPPEVHVPLTGRTAIEDFYQTFNCCSPYHDKIPHIDEKKIDEESVPLYYLDEEIFSSKIIDDCLKTNYSEMVWQEKGLDPFYGIKTSEGSFDYFLLRQMRIHPSRTEIFAQAKYMFLGFPISFYEVAFHNEGRCNRQESVRQEWLQNLTIALARAKEYHITTVIFVGIWAIEWPEGFFEVLAKHKKRVLFAVPDEWGFVNHNRFSTGKIKLHSLRIVPYKATSWLEDIAFNPNRNVSFYFAGNMNRNRHGVLRTQIRWMKRPGAEIIDNDFREEVRNETTGYDGKKIEVDLWTSYIQNSIKKSKRNSESVKRTRFCLIPVGDTATSRRLFDSMAAGCIPVYIGPINTMYRNLPLTSQIDWRSLILFAGAFGCVDVLKLAEWLDKAPLKYSDEIEELARRNHEVYHKYLSPFVPGFLSGFLRELDKERTFKDIVECCDPDHQS